MEKVPASTELYRHINGYTYLVLCVAREEDLGVDFVVHKGMHDGRIWVRSVQNFMGYKGDKPRFEKVS